HRCEWLLLEGVFTHFPASDEGEPSGPRRQLNIFGTLLERLAEDGIHPRWRHAANSGAVLDLPTESCLDMVRPGVATFGLHP
ncbi:alanine racemase, partial [Klebsiella pneumoniae]|uniref:alanine racemase n=1 Tax=Klebsiella pneumoniae TaxID=573 RepID=UPI0034DF9BFC